MAIIHEGNIAKSAHKACLPSVQLLPRWCGACSVCHGLLLPAVCAMACCVEARACCGMLSLLCPRMRLLRLQLPWPAVMLGMCHLAPHPPVVEVHDGEVDGPRRCTGGQGQQRA